VTRASFDYEIQTARSGKVLDRATNERVARWAASRLCWGNVVNLVHVPTGRVVEVYSKAMRWERT
jgi:hypothetical protein